VEYHITGASKTNQGGLKDLGKPEQTVEVKRLLYEKNAVCQTLFSQPMYAIDVTNAELCPVARFMLYGQRRPTFDGTSPFYLSVIKNPKTAVLYKKKAMGIHPLESMV
jgi:hypothetical protein